MILILRLKLGKIIMIAQHWNIRVQLYLVRGGFQINVEEDLPNQFQGRSAFAIATSAKLAKENLQGSPSLKLTGKKAKKLPVVQQNNDASVFHRKMECLNSIVCNGMEVVQSDSQCVSGKREDHGILNPDLSDDSDTRNYEFCMKKKPSKRQKLCLQPSDQIDYHNDAYGCKVDGHDESCFVNEPDATGHTLTCRNRSSDVIMNEQITSVCLENIISEDYMKLLDFDDDADEERYRAARERPLSPTLPELESPRLWHSTDNCHTFAYGVSRGKCELENEKLVSIIESNGPNSHSLPSSQDQVDSNLIPGKISPGHTSEEIDMASILNSSLDSSQLLLDRCLHVGSGDTVAVANETCHSFRTCHASDLGLIKNVNERRGEPCDQVDSEHTILDDNREKKIALDIENDLSIDKGASQIDVIWESRSSMKMETVKKISLSKLKELKCVSEVNGHEHLGAYGCCAVFSYTKDEQVISRIFSTRNAIMHDTSWGCETGFLIAMVLHALAVKLDLSAEEKVCVFFSLLLCKISTMVPVDHATYMAGDLPPELEMFISEMDRVISDAETRSLFIATCELDIFVSLIQNFLTARKVMICEDTLCEPSNLCTTDNVYCLDNGTRNWSLRTAAINELIAACTILASISTILDRIDILWQTSFQLLQRCKGDSYWILTAVHVFASLCGMKFFSPANQNLIVAAIKSLVQLLERGKESGSVDSNGDKGPRFSVCTKCPFAEGEVCVDKVTSQLLGELRRCTVHATRHPDPKQLVNVSYDDLRACINKSDGHDSREIQFDIPSKEFDAFCSLHNFVHPLDQNADKVCCHFTDIVSLVELFGYYMGWECLYSKIIQQLFTLLESCASSAFSVSLLVLIGQLGRIGIESGDCGDRDIEGVMCSLLTFLDMSGTGKSSLPIQFAAVETLLNLLSLDFRDIVDASSMISLEASRVAVVEHVRRWFYQLGEKQKAVSLGLFHKGDMKKSSYF
uniref:Calcium-transporting ATPase 10, plasma membrane-type n=1 Tax=Anthurium amnicola TaxID=1678845 RepID=A0A1D1YBP2_9ARAE